MYCNKLFQKRHWKQHKEVCNAMMASSTRDRELRSEFQNMENLTNLTSEAINTECSICLSAPMEQPVVLEACQHAFCLKCIQSWQRQCFINLELTAKKCPLCREDVKETDPADILIQKARVLADLATLDNKDGASENKHRYLQESLAILDGVIAAGDALPHLLALFTKAEVLKKMGEYKKAIAMINKVILLNNDRNDNRDKLKNLINLAEAAHLREDYAENGRLLGEVETLAMNLGTIVDSGTTQNFQANILKAGCYQDMNDWGKANDVYKSMLKTIPFAKSNEVTEQEGHQIVFNVARCCYELGDYKECIIESNFAILMYRHHPGCHKYKALSEKALGQLDKAIATMIQACLYEAPWDAKNKQLQLDLYDQLVAEKRMRKRK
jgi:tetratricopeptide (TPR) repeat protein